MGTMINDQVVFTKMAENIRNAIVAERGLPDQVFQSVYNRFIFLEFDIFSGAEFWRLLQNLANFSGDSHIEMTLLDPDAISYFYNEFGSFGALRLSIRDSGENYFNALSTGPDASPVDALLHNSETIVWLSDSGKWAIWGERSFGVAVLALREDFKPTILAIAKLTDIGTKSADEALNSLVAPNFKGRIVPKSWASEFLNIYGKKLEPTPPEV